MGLFSRLLGFRWSLYIVLDDTFIAYAMHEHSVMRMVGYVMGYFANGAKPVEPWSLCLNYNHKHKTIILGPEHFTQDGSVTSTLVLQIEAIDPGWRVKGGEPVFEEADTKKRLKISEYPDGISMRELFENFDKPEEITFHSVMNEVFGKTKSIEW